ncbi:hypothetical protein GH714_004794 [Hevea brasiliensis]|uniref:Rhamnogalacturonan endolyase n=1 Tax=Hevea brasiliensis TaxID=3981 RepID=A0A6A6NFS9_HEVBR|nr:hypothetical protein GH714_004794 [Hevea brasiliensis]
MAYSPSDSQLSGTFIDKCLYWCLYKYLKLGTPTELPGSFSSSQQQVQNSSSSGFHVHQEIPEAVRLQIQENYVVVDNGFLQLTISNPEGFITGIQYNGLSNLLEVLNDEADRGYWDLVWSDESTTRKKGNLTGTNMMDGTSFKVILQNEEQIELSFTRTWNSSLHGKIVPLNIDKRYVILSGSSGFYTYAIYEHLKEWPAFDLDNTRIAFKLRKDKFHYMAIADDRQRYMPLPNDRLEGRGQVLAYPEAVLLVNPIEPEFKGEVDDKYEYSCESRNNGVHGWISNDSAVGFWLITPSYEFRYIGNTMVTSLELLEHGIFHLMHLSDENIPADGAYVGLAPPGDVGSWQLESKGYQFWVKADEDGQFTISNVRPGGYNLYAWVPGFIGDYKYDTVINISAGCDITIGDLVYEPPRNGSTLWEIGIPDRSAAEFYIPDPNPNYVNKLYLNHTDRFRQYGLWERYTELYPDGDLVFTIGTSDYAKDWFFQQVTRKINNNTYQGTTWQIKFKLDGVDQCGTYKLRLALATANVADLQVRINDPNANSSLFSTGIFGKDNTIARHGIHGIYRLFNIDIPGAQIIQGNNTIFLTQASSTSPFQGIMYDYIRLEGLPSSNTIKKI